MSRRKKLVLNTITALLKQAITIICGFILPRLFLVSYGSDVNGLVSSISQFLGLASVFDSGMGVVIESSLFEPLAKKNKTGINKVLTSGQKFYFRFVLILAIYVFLLAAIYPYIVINSFEYMYTFTLILAISISHFGQYCLGVTNTALLSADQRGYINYILNIATIVVNTIISVILIKLNYSVQIVKLVSSLIFLVRPVILAIYVKSYYKVSFNEKYTEEPIKQKWNGFTQHIAALVVGNTDIVVLTLFTDLKVVSIYTVYFLVINGIKTLITSFTAGIRSLFGDMLARNDKKIKDVFKYIEWGLHVLIVVIYLITFYTIVPFVLIYTRGVTDVNYEVHTFAGVICIAYAIYSLRTPYLALIMSAGHFKETQNSAIIEAIINIVISVVLVIKLGIVGVAMGTLLAMSYRLIYLVRYLKENILFNSTKSFFRLIAMDILIVIVSSVIIYILPKFNGINYFDWGMYAFRCAVICVICAIIINIFFYGKNLKLFLLSILNSFNKIKNR